MEQEPQTSAQYHTPSLRSLQGNPFIEALPAKLTSNEFIKRLNRWPMLGEEERSLQDHDRILALADLKRLYITTGVHEDIHRRITDLMCYGYVSRNPLRETAYWKAAAQRADYLDTLSSAAPHNEVESSASALTILGISGIGKTTLINRLRSLYPRYIDHGGNYKGQSFGSYRQIPWLSIHVPERGSIKGLILTFFKAVDAVAGTRHYANHTGNGRRSVESMVPSVATVVAEHGIGLLSLDELHNLNVAASGGDVAMINFLVRLIDTANLPIIMIGSYACLDFLTKEFRILRRALANGGVIWDRMVYDDIWHFFAETMWRFQVLRRPTKYSEQFGAILYDECQGITAYAVEIFKKAQIIAINEGAECITPNILRQAARHQLSEITEVIQALRTNNRRALEKMGDVFPRNLAERLKDGFDHTNGGIPTAKQPNYHNVAAQPDPQLLSDTVLPSEEKSVDVPDDAPLSSEIMTVLRAVKADDSDAHLVALRQAGLIADLSEILDGSA